VTSHPPVTGETLAGVQLFAELDLKARDQIARLCTGRAYSAREAIVSYKDTSRDVYFVLSGDVDVTLYSVNGKRITFNAKGAGEVVGELAAIDSQPRCADVVARNDVRIISMSGSDFQSAMSQHPEAARKMMLLLTAQVRELSERVFEFNALCVNNRIHVELLRNARHGTEEGDRRVISPAPTHADIASRVSTHREAVTRELSRLTKDGLLQKDKDALIVTSIKALEQLVEQSLGEIPLVC